MKKIKYAVKATVQFRRDYKTAIRRGLNIELLDMDGVGRMSCSKRLAACLTFGRPGACVNAYPDWHAQ